MKLDRESDYIFGISLSFDIRGNRNIIFKVFKLILLSMEHGNEIGSKMNIDVSLLNN